MSKRQSISEGLDSLFDIKIPPSHVTNARPCLPVKVIYPNDNQPRKYINESALNGLVESIKENGILQAIVVRKLKEDFYQIVAGERRWRAAKKLDLEMIPVFCVDVPEESVLAYALVENIQRADLNVLEEAEAYQKLIAVFGLTHEQVAKRVGRSRSSVSNMLRLIDLDSAVKQALVNQQIEMGHARALLSLSKTQQQEALYFVLKKSLTVRQAESLVKELLYPKNIVDIKNERKYSDLLSSYQQLADLYLSETMNAKIKIDKSLSGAGELTLQFSTQAEYEEILEKHK